MASSNDVQRLYLQAIMSRRFLSQKLAAQIWYKCVEAVKAVDETLDIDYGEDRASWDAWVTKINAALNPLDLEFAHTIDEPTGKDMYAIVNRKSDEIAQLATEYQIAEITYFKAILEQIMLAPNESYCVSSLAALREVSHLKSTMTKTQAERVLGSFVARGWLVKSNKGRYSLATRAILELQPYLRSTYPDEVLECTICMEMVTSGIACPTQACKIRFHTHCYTGYRRLHAHCPACGGTWGAADDQSKMGRVGERAFRDGQENRGRRVRRSADDDEEDEEDEEEQEDEREQSQASQPVAVKKEKKGKGKKKVIESDEEEEEEEADADEQDEESPPPRTQGKRKSRR
ncbi:Nse1 non-SMC component of SMC5-6 complex-domain and zf-RING-like domain-containing protein [Phanerochaete sordida]|uniref:Non-structural maintenance of chromosomes element 1 homolog n=1 Tax=Phanerochaete sordida TaxID=48140 RepID=A0A9P3G9T0_9APHY|nr:Nse1 non-SMC component of SMC5-6 complex-domain and zf-RING-like domain-containing protein [Phanerochaete sordida]